MGPPPLRPAHSRRACSFATSARAGLRRGAVAGQPRGRRRPGHICVAPRCQVAGGRPAPLQRGAHLSHRPGGRQCRLPPPKGGGVDRFRLRRPRRPRVGCGRGGPALGPPCRPHRSRRSGLRRVGLTSAVAGVLGRLSRGNRRTFPPPRRRGVLPRSWLRRCEAPGGRGRRWPSSRIGRPDWANACAGP